MKKTVTHCRSLTYVRVMSIEFDSDYKGALAYAARVHREQLRKDRTTRYIVRPMFEKAQITLAQPGRWI